MCCFLQICSVNILASEVISRILKEKVFIICIYANLFLRLLVTFFCLSDCNN
jgi:hypothetical protein